MLRCSPNRCFDRLDRNDKDDDCEMASGGGGTGGARMTLTILEQPLRIASIPNGSLRTYCHALLHSFLFARYEETLLA